MSSYQVTTPTELIKQQPQQSYFLIKRWLRNHQTRRSLLALTDQQLKDVGITKNQAIEEAAKHFWEY